MLGTFMLSILATDSVQQDLEKLRQGFLERPSGEQQLEFWGYVLAFLSFVAICVKIAMRKPGAPKPPKKFDYLTVAVDVLGLSELDRRMLLRISSRAGLDQPAAMLLSPMNLAHALHEARTNGAPADVVATAERLCKQLFDSPLPAYEPPKKNVGQM